MSREVLQVAMSHKAPVAAMGHEVPESLQSWEPRPAGAFGQARAALVVALPLCDSGAGVALDVAEQELTLGVADKYALRAPLPFAVDSESTRAKFSRREKTMTITVEQRI